MNPEAKHRSAFLAAAALAFGSSPGLMPGMGNRSFGGHADPEPINSLEDKKAAERRATRAERNQRRG